MWMFLTACSSTPTTAPEVEAASEPALEAAEPRSAAGVAEAAPEVSQEVPLIDCTDTEGMLAFFQEQLLASEDGVLVVDGDIGVPVGQLSWYVQTVCREQLGVGERLIVYAPNGEKSQWPESDWLNLTYCVSKDFDSKYGLVVSTMASVTKEWEQATHSHIRFQHRSAEDDDCTRRNRSVLFDVRPSSSGEYRARAFYPHYKRRHRSLLISTAAFAPDGNLTLDGILRHEVGHSLGFRHEFTRKEGPKKCFEDSQFVPISSYDPHSVMHHPKCKDGVHQGDDLTLSSTDRRGALLYYTPTKK